MNFGRFNRTGVFDYMRRDPAPPVAAGGGSDSAGGTASGLAAGTNGAGGRGPAVGTGTNGVPTQIFTRPRAGASIINGVAPGLTVGQPGGAAAGGQAQGEGANGATGGEGVATQEEKQKLTQYDYHYTDCEDLMTEIDEFYPYVEMPEVLANQSSFKEAFDGDWTAASQAERRAFMELELESFESPVASTRRRAQARILYLLQGCFADVSTPEEQVHWIKENATTLRSVDGIATLVVSLRDATRRYNATADPPEKPAANPWGYRQPDPPGKPSANPFNFPTYAEVAAEASSSSSANHVDTYNERSAELMDVLAMLYFVIEVFKGDDTFAEELMSTTPPLPLVLFQMISALKEKLPKGYPVKKVLLLLWKTLLACFGGMQDAAKALSLSRELAGLQPVVKDFTKATPVDISNFRRDTSVKYPTFAPPPSASSAVPDEKLAESFKPIPPRPNYHSTEIPTSRPINVPAATAAGAPHHQGQGSMPMPGTPAPSPQASPPPAKQKKQQYQTDPNKPFIFPYSRSSAASAGPSGGTDAQGPTSLVPFAIAEADKLYQRHMYVSLGTYQMWEAREELMREERGLGRAGLIGLDPVPGADEEEAEMAALSRQWKYEEEEQQCFAKGDKEGAAKAKDKLLAAKRLHRVDIVYRSILPIMQNCVIVLLKLLLATVTAPGATGVGGPAAGVLSPDKEQPAPANSTAATTAAAPAPAALPPPTREEIDLARHREITSKAVSGAIILLLKWFKASHVLKFHYFAQLLFDSNCLLLVLKMFGFNDVAVMVEAKNETPEDCFFQYCHRMCSKSATDASAKTTEAVDAEKGKDTLAQTDEPQKGEEAAPEDEKPVKTIIDERGQEVEVLTEFSRRNFFSSINFLKILQKMTKHRAHRTFMLQQYKSSQIFKRMLKVNQPMLQLQVLKLIKSQMPWCERKWRQTNMKVITSIYLNCRPELRDEWLARTDQDTELEGALPQEHALRELTQFYNKRYYGIHMAASVLGDASGQGHGRSDSIAAVTLEDPALREQASLARSRPSLTDPDIFPPRKTDIGTTMPYNPDGMIEFWLHEYDDLLTEVFGGEGGGASGATGWDGEGGDEYDDDDMANLPARMRRMSLNRSPAARAGPIGPAERGDGAWQALGEIMGGGGDEEVISDSESVVSVGELGPDARLGGVSASAAASGEDDNEDDDRDAGGNEEETMGFFGRMQRRRPSDNENTWEHMSPTTMSLLPKSPRERRRSSSSSGGAGSPLRPVIPTHMLGRNGRDVFDDEDGDDEGDMLGPMPIVRETEDERDRQFGAVDEVEYAYGE